MAKTYDLLVIGAGMAGVAAANKCASQGWNVAIVDAQPYGGTCALRGCDPKKILRRGAEIIDSAWLMRGKGIDDPALTINWQDLMKHKRGFTDPVPHNLERDLASHGVDTLHGQARFLAKNRVDIAGARLEAGHFLIATGAPPPSARLPRPRAPDRQRRLPEPRHTASPDPVRRRRLHLLRVRPHRGARRQHPDRHRPRAATPEGIRPRPGGSADRPQPAGGNRHTALHNNHGRRQDLHWLPGQRGELRSRRDHRMRSSTGPAAKPTLPASTSAPPVSTGVRAG